MRHPSALLFAAALLLIPCASRAAEEGDSPTKQAVADLRALLDEALARLADATRRIVLLEQRPSPTDEARALGDSMAERDRKGAETKAEIERLRGELAALREQLAAVDQRQSASVAYDHGLVLRAGGASLTVNGLVQARFTAESLSSNSQPDLGFRGVNSVDLHHAELSIAGNAGRFARAVLMLDLGGGYFPGAPFAIQGGLLRDAYLDVKPISWLTLRAGQFAVPFGHQRSLDDRALAAPGRSLATLAFATDRDLGALLQVSPWGDRLLLQLSVTDGINAGDRGARNDNLDFRYVGHVALSPLGAVAPVEGNPEGNGPPRFTVGGALLYDLLPTNDRVNSDRAGTGHLDNVEVLSANAELEASWGRLSAQAEYFWRRENYGALAPVTDRRFQGFYAQAQAVLWPRYAIAEAHLAYAEPHLLGTANANGSTPPSPFGPLPGANASVFDTLQPASAWQAGGSLIALRGTHDLKLQMSYDWNHHVVGFTPGCQPTIPCEVDAHVVQLQATVGF